MSLVRKLYKYYLRKIFRQSWLWIILTVFIVWVWWFGLPFLLYRTRKSLALKEFQEESEQGPEDSEGKKQVEQWTFRSWLQVLFGKETETKVGNSIFKSSKEEIWKLNRKGLVEKIQELKEEEDQEIKEELKEEISKATMVDRSLLLYSDSPFKADVAFFFCQTEGYQSGKPFLKLLNDISWWNLTGPFALTFLFLHVLDNIFFKPQKDGEESMILNLTPGIKRSDLFFNKILSFLTFYFIANLLLFLLPFGFYYWWMGINTNISWFILLTLWTIIIGPILFFVLIFAPYLFLKAKFSWLDWRISILFSFFPTAWFWTKVKIPNWTWLWSVENWFFDPAWFIPISLIVGIIFLALYLWHYQEQDLK